MSNPIAVSILAKLTSWWDFEGNTNDAKGVNPLTMVVSPGYEAGKVGQSLKHGARGHALFSPTVALDPTTAQLSIGGWALYSTVNPDTGNFGLTSDYASPANEILFIKTDNVTKHFVAFGQTFVATQYQVTDPSASSLAYPISVSAEDANGAIASSPQVINIFGPGGAPPPGWYFTVATYDKKALALYINGVLVASGVAEPTIRTPMTAFQIANQYSGTISDVGLDSVFCCTHAVITADEVAYMFNGGLGLNYAQIVADAA